MKVLEEHTMNTQASFWKRFEGTKEQQHALAVSLLAQRILAAKRAAVQERKSQ